MKRRVVLDRDYLRRHQVGGCLGAEHELVVSGNGPLRLTGKGGYGHRITP
jgi:hypothetical protein